MGCSKRIMIEIVLGKCFEYVYLSPLVTPLFIFFVFSPSFLFSRPVVLQLFPTAAKKIAVEIKNQAGDSPPSMK